MQSPLWSIKRLVTYLRGFCINKHCGHDHDDRSLWLQDLIDSPTIRSIQLFPLNPLLMTAAVSAWARTIIPMNSTGAGVEAGPQLFLTTASVSDYNEIGGEAWMDYPAIRLPITRLLLPRRDHRSSDYYYRPTWSKEIKFQVPETLETVIKRFGLRPWNTLDDQMCFCRGFEDRPVQPLVETHE